MNGCITLKIKKTEACRFLSLLLATMFILLFTACEKQTPNSDFVPTPHDNVSTSAATPLLWRATSPEGASIYLFGSIHAANESLYPLPDYVMNAFESCDYLAVELDVVKYSSDKEYLTAFLDVVAYPEGENIYDDLSEELIEQAWQLISGGDEKSPRFLDGYRPYMWYEYLLTAAVDAAGLSFDDGVDRHLIQAAMDRGVEVLDIENPQDTIALGGGFSPKLVLHFIEELLDVDKAKSEVLELYEAWKRGDVLALREVLNKVPEDLTDELEKLYAEYMNALLTVRDVQMTQVAKKYMEEELNVFYVVGVAHLVGENGIITQLLQAGYTVERVADEEVVG